MMLFTDSPPPAESGPERIFNEHFVEQALADMDLVVDVTTGDLQRLINLTLIHAEKQQLTPHQIKLGHYYTNGKHGPEWCVRQIIDESAFADPKKDMVIYRVVEGQGLRSDDSCSRTEFAHWAAREVYTNK